MKSLKRLAPLLTFVWIATTIFILYLNRGAGFNEVGDFVAGMIAPLALFWLVIGFYQQGEQLRLQRLELEQNTGALLLQAEELKNQVAETKELVRHTSRQADLQESEFSAAQKKEEPILTPIPWSSVRRGSGMQSTSIKFINNGGTAINLQANTEGVETIEAQPAGGLDNGKMGTINIRHEKPFNSPCTIIFTYETKSGEKRKIHFAFSEETEAKDLVEPFRKWIPIKN